MTHYANKKQEEAFKEVVKAFQKARKLGLVFYGKSDTLIAYTKQADNYIDQVPFHQACATGYSSLPCLTALKCISDSGADDYGSYRSQEDEDKYKRY